MGYTKQVAKGISWLGAFRGMSRGISFVRTIILARILTPSQFGFFAIASLVLSFTELVTETGINIVLIQKKENIDKYIDTAWVTSILRGFIVGIIILIAAPFVIYFFNMPQALPLILLMSVVPVIRGFINPSKVKLVKDLRFREEFFYNILMFLVEFIVVVCVALFTKSAISLVWGLVAGAIFDVVASFIVFKPLPHVAFKKSLFKDIIGSGKWLTATGILSYAFQNIDNIVIGRMLGAAPLGLYDVSYRISLLPLTEVTDVIGKASFPVFVKINNDIKRLKRAYIMSISGITGISLCIGIILFLFPEQIILIILGKEWLGAVQVLQLLSLVGVSRAVFVSVVYPLYALNRQKVVTQLMFISLVILGMLIVPAVSMWGLIGAAGAALISTLVVLPLAFYLVFKAFKTASL